MSCLIIDDEPIARDILRDYISRDERLNLVGCYKSAGDALKEIGIKQSLLVFLDINMPKISGFELLRSMPQHPMVIFTTAFREYALEGFNLNAVDYLLKPFSFERFLQAVNKAYVVFTSQHSELKSSHLAKDDLFVKSDGKLVRIHIDEIYFIEALKEYVKLVTSKGNIITYQSMQLLEEKLPEDQFFRIHRSYIVALAHVQMIEGNMVYVNNMPLPVSRSCKDEFMQRITRGNLL